MTTTPAAIGADVIREAFEKDFFADAPLDISARDRCGDGYEFSIADNAWRTWKRAWEVALTSAAPQPAPREPLTREQAWEIVNKKTGVMMAIRLTEAAHGITARKEQA